MKIEIKLLTVENGQPKEIELNGEIYSIHPIKTPVLTRTMGILEGLSSPSGLDKGKKVIQLKSNSLYENVINELKGNINESPEQIRRIVSKYYPKYKYNSLKAITNLYRRYVRGDYTSQITQKLQQHIRKKYAKRKPYGAITKDKSYDVWITEDDVKKVKVAVGKFGFGYTPNLPTLMKETNLKRGKLLGVIKYMKEQGLIQLVNNEKGTFYQPIVRVE